MGTLTNQGRVMSDLPRLRLPQSGREMEGREVSSDRRTRYPYVRKKAVGRKGRGSLHPCPDGRRVGEDGGGAREYM